MDPRTAYALLFVGVMAENAGVPVPGETLLLAAAAIAAKGQLSVVAVAVIGAVAAMVGDNLGFAVGRKAGRPTLMKRAGRLLKAEHIARADRFFEEHGAWAVFFARFISGVRVVAALAAGSSTMPWHIFVIANAAGAIVWSTAVATVGYFGLKAAEHLLAANRAVQLLVILVGAIIIGWLVVTWWRARQRRTQ